MLPHPLRLLQVGLKLAIGIFLSVLTLMLLQHAQAQSPQDIQQAQALMAPPYRTEVLLVQGSGTPTAITRWTYFFYDPTAPNNLREVRIVDGKVDLFEPADLHRAVQSDLVFDPSLNPVPAAAALSTAGTYAANNQITYDQTRVLLRRPDAGQAPQWRVELLQDGRSRGVIYTGPPSAQFVRYAPASSPDGNDSATAAGFFDDVKNTFLGIGGDLQQFFTGKRTVDQ